MKQVTQKTLGFLIPVTVPESVEEFDSLAGEAGACLSEAVDNVMYRGHLNRARAIVVKVVEEKTGIARREIGRTAPRKDGSTSPVYEKDGLYVPFALQQAKLSPADIQSAVAEACAVIPFEVNASRTGGRIAKEWLNAADELIALVEDAGVDYSKFMANVEANHPVYEFEIDSETGNPTRESIAIALRLEDDCARNEAKRRAREAAGV